jgi:preprotein translocase SecE subunit
MSNPSVKFNPFAWVASYLREAKEEMEKVTWPSQSTTVRYSIVVVAVSVGIAAFFAGLDWLLNLGLKELIARLA